MHESEAVFSGEREPNFRLLIPRLHYEVWKDRPDIEIADKDYVTTDENTLGSELRYNKRRTAWFDAVYGTVQMLNFVLQEKGVANTDDLKLIQRAEVEMGEVLQEASGILHNKSPKGSETKQEELIARGEEWLEKIYDIAEKYNI